ncbi:MAG TPA: hypothetical protein VNR90_05920 [Vicinamibacterales bacterium]|nr:hypothetical protein [Vicinamibacterales bacterium]
MPLLFAVLLALQAPSTCPDVPSCRAEAEAAAARGDYEAFHDLAWRTAQKGKPNDPALMFLLARAQSMSGRPDDALVMLQRLAGMHAAIDLTLPDFERVRRLPGWADLSARVSGTAPVGAAPPASLPNALAAGAEPPRAASPAPAAESADAGVTLTFAAPSNLGPFALAHDTVSRRFVIGDAPSRRLLVVDEVSKHVVAYVGAASAGFSDDLTAMSLDARRGDLWVASATGSGGAAATSIVHKLQLVSGRGLMEARPPDALLPVRFVDLAVAPDGTVFALDAAGARLFRLRPGSRSLEMAMHLEAAGAVALAIADDHTAFVAGARGLWRIDLESHAAQAVKSPDDLSGFISLAWRNGALIGVQRAAGASLVVRVALDAAGTRSQPRAILAASASPIVGTLADGRFYYLVGGAITRLPLR